MPEMRQYKCLNCGYRFEVEVFTQEELKKSKQESKPIYGDPARCRECHR